MALQRSAIAAITITSGATLGNSLTAVASSSAVTVSSSANVVDHQIVVSVGVGAITASASTVVNVFVAGSTDGATWSGGSATTEVVNGTDSAVTLSANGNDLIFVGSIPCHTASVTHKSKPLPIAPAFGGSMPAKYVVVLQNQTGLALTSAAIAGQEIYYN